MYTDDSKKMILIDLGNRNNVLYDPRFFNDIYGHFKSNNNDLLTIFDPLYGYDIEDFKKLNSIPINDVNFALVDEEHVQDIIYHLNNVMSFGLDDCGALDFTTFTRLKSLGYTWYKDTVGLNKVTTLEGLSLSKFNTRSKNLEYLSELTNLNELNLFKSTFTSLSGIENLEINSLMLAYLSKFEDLTSFGGNSNVTTLNIISCKKLDVNLLPEYFPNVETLTIESQGTLATIEPLLKGMQKLEEISVMERTKIEDAKSNSFYTKYLKDKRYYIKGFGSSKDW